MATLNVIVHINTNSVNEFLTGFYKMHPMPTNAAGQPLYTDTDWVTRCTKDFLSLHYRTGKANMAADSAGTQIIFDP